MNKINIQLGHPGDFSIKDVNWVQRKRTGKNLSIPVVSHSYGNKSVEIWNQYFMLIFYNLNLLQRITANKEELKKHARNLHDYLFSKDNLIMKDNLLDLLTGDPKKIKDTIYIKTEKGVEIAKKVFNYEYLASQYRNEFASLILSLNVNTCPYCGRAFTTTAAKKGNRFARTCQVDHFFPQSQYPWLALSLWNMVPSCGFCNNQKLDKSNRILYPHEDDMGDIYRFTTHPTKGIGYLVGTLDSENDFTVSLDPVIPHPDSSDLSDYEKQIENEISLFAINELYSTHNSYVCNIFRQRFTLGNPYIDNLVASFRDLFPSREDVKAMLYLKRIDSESIGNTPLDKLTRDIDHEIDMIEE